MATLEEPGAVTAGPDVVLLTERAATKIKELQADEPSGDADVLRIAVQGGGCSGFQYALGFDEGPQEGDAIIDMHGVRLVVDPFSLPYLRGAGVDFVDGLNGTGFKIENPNVVAGCGCGSSFQMKDEESPGDEPDAAGGCGTCASH